MQHLRMDRIKYVFVETISLNHRHVQFLSVVELSVGERWLLCVMGGVVFDTTDFIC